MARILLGINCNFAANRYTEPREWTRIVGEELGLRYAQFVTDLLDPYLPYEIQERVCKEILEACQKYNVKIYATFGGHFAHQHYLGHPDDEIRKEAEKWFQRLITQTALLGGAGTGTCFAIMTEKDNRDAKRREYILNQAVEAYRRLAVFARGKGLEYLMFEPTSVPRESAHTIEETKDLLKNCEEMDVPMRLCLDVGHGSIASENSGDGDPYTWIREFGAISPVIHIQQTDKKCSQHWPFIPGYNEKGIIEPKKVVEAIEESGAKEVLLAFEISHRAFDPLEDKVIDDLKESVKYWRSYVKE